MLLKEASNLKEQKYKSLYRQLTLRFHPDNKKTGDSKKMAELNDAAEKGDFYFKLYLAKLADQGILQRVGESPKKENQEDLKEKMEKLSKEAKEENNKLGREMLVKLIKVYLDRYIPSLEKLEGVSIVINYLDKELEKISFEVSKKRNGQLFNVNNFYSSIVVDNIINYEDLRYVFAYGVREFKNNLRNK